MKWKSVFSGSAPEPEPEQKSDVVAEALGDLKKSVDLFQSRLSYVEGRITQLADKIKAVQETQSPEEKVQNQYFKEVADLALAMGPAFKGVMATCFTPPDETMRVNGYNSAFQEALSQATDALDGIDDLKKEQVALRRTTTALSTQITKAVESSVKPRLPRKSSKAN